MRTEATLPLATGFTSGSESLLSLSELLTGFTFLGIVAELKKCEVSRHVGAKVAA